MQLLPRLLSIFLFILLFLLLNKFLWLFDGLIAPIYDIITFQSKITTLEQLEKRYASLPKVTTSDFMEKPHAAEFGMCKVPKKQLGKHDFVVVEGFDRYKYVVGHFRLRDFVTKGKFGGLRLFGKSLLKRPIWNLDKVQYVRLSKKILVKILLLQQELAKQELDPNAFRITSGYRYPKYNKWVGGATRSRHLHGDAVDIKVADINKDGKITQEDKKLVFAILNKKVIRNEGGIGTYKSMPMVIHFDTRGNRARW